jgi:hypothetical protein
VFLDDDCQCLVGRHVQVEQPLLLGEQWTTAQGNKLESSCIAL